MFQSWFVELVAVLGDVCVGLSAVTVAVLGIIGLRQWKAELTGRTKFEVARRMAKLALQYRDEVKRSRNTFTFPGESAEREKGENESREVTHILDEYYARRKRLVPLQTNLRDLYETSWEAELLLDEKIGEFIEPLEQVFKNLFASIETYFPTQYNNVGRHQPIEPQELSEQQRNIIYGPDDDEFSKSVDRAVDELIKELKKFLE